MILCCFLLLQIVPAMLSFQFPMLFSFPSFILRREIYLLVTPLTRMSHFKIQVFLVQFPFMFSLIFPGRYITVVRIVSFGLSFLSLAFFTKMATTTFLSVQSVYAYQFAQFNKIGHATSLIQFGIHFIDLSG